MGEGHVVHRLGGGAQIGEAGGVVADVVAEPGHAPGLVDRGGGPEPVAQPPAHQVGELGEALGRLAHGPAAAPAQPLGQLPVVERRHRLQPPLQHPVDQPVVEVDAFPVDLHAVGHHPRPGRREAVGVEARVAHQVEVRLPAVVVVAGDLPVLAVDDVAGDLGEGVPVGAAGPAVGMALDLVGGGGGGEEEALGEVAAANGEVGHVLLSCMGAGPVEPPRTRSHSQTSCTGV